MLLLRTRMAILVEYPPLGAERMGKTVVRTQSALGLLIASLDALEWPRAEVARFV